MVFPLTHKALISMKTFNLKYLLIGAALLIAAGSAIAVRPTHHLANDGPKVDLETMIPQKIGDWQLEKVANNQLVNPQTQAAIDRIYTQVLSRTYVNSQGYRIMLMIPYGADQSDDMAVHDPEGCYPAQGFKILAKSMLNLNTDYGQIPARRMQAENGPRHEPVTYWSTVGGKAVNNGWDRKLAQLSHVMKGDIPDGLLFRVSSIDPRTDNAFQMQQSFINDLLKVLPPESRTRVAGLTQ